jgi:hypothetical protein
MYGRHLRRVLVIDDFVSPGHLESFFCIIKVVHTVWHCASLTMIAIPVREYIKMITCEGTARRMADFNRSYRHDRF